MTAMQAEWLLALTCAGYVAPYAWHQIWYWTTLSREESIETQYVPRKISRSERTSEDTWMIWDARNQRNAISYTCAYRVDAQEICDRLNTVR